MMPDYYYDTDEFTFVWDEDKNNLNIRKHGIPFTIAARVFEYPDYFCTACHETGAECV